MIYIYGLVLLLFSTFFKPCSGLHDLTLMRKPADTGGPNEGSLVTVNYLFSKAVLFIVGIPTISQKTVRGIAGFHSKDKCDTSP